MRKTMRLSVACACGLFCSFSAGAADDLSARPERETGLYACGETATFVVTVPKGEKSVRWKLDNFGTNVFAEGTGSCWTDGTVRVCGTSPKPGFLRLTAWSVSNLVIASAGFDVTKIRSTAPRPADFDAYWKGEFARLQREVPLDPICEYDEALSTNHPWKVYRLSFATFNDRRLWGFMSIPRDLTKAPFAGRLRICDAGNGAIAPWEASANKVTITMNVHYFKPGKTREEQARLIQATSDALAAKYALKPGTYYANGGISESREAYYFHDSMVGLSRVVDWLAARPEVDPNRLVYFGCSQGGGFGLATVFMNPRYRRVVFAVPAITGHAGDEDGWQCGWPDLIANQPAPLRGVARRNAAYFDGVHFAAGIRLPVRFIVGFSDVCCPPPNVYAAFNVCPSKDKAIVNCLGAGHCGWREWIERNRQAPSWLDPNAWLEEFGDR